MTTTQLKTELKTWTNAATAMPPIEGTLEYEDNVELHSIDVLLRGKEGLHTVSAYFNFTFFAWTLPDQGDFIDWDLNS